MKSTQVMKYFHDLIEKENQFEMEKLPELIKEVLHLPQAEVEIIETLGGMTNINYLVSINTKNYIVRVPGNGTEDFINRKEEKENLELSAALGINPEHIYLNVENGLKITKKIENAKTLTAQTAKDSETMKMVTDIFKKVHRSNARMNNRFELFTLMKKFELLALNEDAETFKGYAEVKEDIMSLKLDYQSLEVEECPCHIDPSYTNFIVCGAGNLYLIDWEYSGMFDPLWDLAAHSMESGFSELEEADFLTYYYQRPLTKVESKRILMHKIFQDYLWSLWTTFKEAKGDDFGTYGIKRFERAKMNIELFKEVFTETVG